MVNLEPFRSPEARARFIAKYDAILEGWPVPFAERDVATHFGSTHVIVSGPASAPPLVLLHGAGCTAVMWGPVIEVLSGEYRCYCIDTIVEGNKSRATKKSRGIPNLVAWLSEVFAALDVTSARVVGFSYGGWLAANLAIHAPALVEKLVLMAPAATFGAIPVEFYARVFSANLLNSRSQAVGFFQWLSSTPDAASNPLVDLMVTGMLDGRAMRLDVKPPTVLSDDGLSRIGAPTTVIIGQREVVYRRGPAAALARADALIPNVRTTSIPGANHILTMDATDALVAELRAALG